MAATSAAMTSFPATSNGRIRMLAPLIRGVAHLFARRRRTPEAPNRPDDLAERLVGSMKRSGYDIAVGRDVVNIVYVEDMDASGNAIADVPNSFDSVRMLLEVAESGAAQILGIWEATTQPGRYWTEHPMN